MLLLAIFLLGPLSLLLVSSTATIKKRSSNPWIASSYQIGCHPDNLADDRFEFGSYWSENFGNSCYEYRNNTPIGMYIYGQNHRM